MKDVFAKVLLAVPPVEWRARVEAIEPQNKTTKLKNAINDLDGEIERLTRLRGYLDGRERGFNHINGVRIQNQLAKKVRTALGYAYPEQMVEF